MQDEYQKQAKEFLSNTGTVFSVIEAVPQKKPLWGKEGKKHGMHYSVTLENKRGKYVFDYWGSIADAEKIRFGEGKKVKPSAYDVLACLSTDYDDNFDDFCDSFGYSSDSIMALATFEAVKREELGLRRIFTSEEMEKLAEIN